jgi:hypothetical protein
MTLNVRGLPFEVPSYSLTGDILSFQRCSLAYRYYNGSSLPPSRPVQMWTGEFVHGVLEEAYRYWSAHHTPFPWPYTPPQWPPQLGAPMQPTNDVGSLGHRVEVRLAASGKRSRSEAARDAAYRRVEAAVNQLCPHLFPLITAAEERISGTRAMPLLPSGEQPRGSRYELRGVVDVISSVMLGGTSANPLVALTQSRLPSTPAGEYDLIVDYKAGRRPAVDSPFRTQFELQVQTYAWLRAQIPQSRPVGAGVLIYINELSPSRDDMTELKRELAHSTTDVIPVNGSADYYRVHTWQPTQPAPNLSFDFRLRRAVHVVDVASPLVQHAVAEIDSVIGQIESSAFREHNTGNIPNNWQACGGAEDCVACDFVHFCPAPAHLRAQLQQPNPPPRTPPLAPG